MDTKQPEALRIAEWLEGIRGNTWPSYIPQEAAAELRRQHAEIETLRAGYDAARLEIESLREREQLARDVNSRRVTELEAQLAAVGAGGVEPLRKRECLHQISEPQAQPVGAVPVAWRYQTPTGWHATTDASAALRVRHHHEVEPLYAAPQPAAPAQPGEYPPLVCDYCGALTPDPWHSSGMLHGKMSKHIHSCAACAAQGAAQAAPVGMEPTARIRYERNTPGRENEMPRVLSCNRMADGVYEVFTASQVQAMLAAVPRNATLYDPDEVAFPVQRSADGVDALPPELASIAAVGVAAEEAAAPSAPAREPLTEEQMHKDLAALCKRIFNARIGKACSNCDGGTYQSDNNGYGQFHRCNKCCYVPMWGEDGRELGAPIAAAQKGGQHGF